MGVAEFLGFADEFFPAAGTADGDLTLPSGDPDHLTALGAVEIAVFAILQTIKEQEEFPVFLEPLVGIPGKGSGERPDHQAIGNGGENQIHQGIPDKSADEGDHHTGGQNYDIQSVCTIAACHKAAEPEGQIH